MQVPETLNRSSYARFTDYHAKYFAHDLTKRCASDSTEKLAGTMAGAQVDLNPHQIEAALFAFRSPLSRGAILADEVGLGKTIEAGLVIAQRWAERRRRILVVTPANLRKQWHQELSEKFFLPCRILESKPYNQDVRRGYFRPFERTDEVVICSYQFARSKEADVANVAWNLVVIDEAHRLRNVYKPSNVVASTLKKALGERQKLLLTATPLQNSLLELFGLVSIVDERTFGDLKSFRERFLNLDQDDVFTSLRARLAPVCHRTLRRQVVPYVPYTRRHALVEEFTPEESEDRLYDLVSEYLRRPNLQALPASQRSLMTLVLRKLLASSTFAIAGALETLSRRLKTQIAGSESPTEVDGELRAEYEAYDETAEEWEEDGATPSVLTQGERNALASEIAELDGFAQLATSIHHNAKGRALIRALHTAFEKARELGAAEKALIFTESRRTQSYLLRVLADSPWADGIVLFNGSNVDDTSKAVYAAWLDRHRGTDRVTGSRSADMRSALVEYFRDDGKIMVATEAGAEGINLQFCSLVVNYDLPWNPQRIEQRIGRCHRYGQKHDVVVVNFLNRANAADQRVFQLLSEKFQLFEGVFGASDEVLGAIESGVDLEKRIHDIYQRCRKEEEVAAAFNELQLELKLEIDETMKDTRRKLLENFDDEVREKLRIRSEEASSALNEFERRLMQLTQHELRGEAEFPDEGSFRLLRAPQGCDVPIGLYELPRRSGEAHTYRLAHPLAEALIARAKSRDLPHAELELDYAAHVGRISALEPLRGDAGYLAAAQFSVEALDQVEDRLIVVALRESGESLDDEVARRLLTLPAKLAEQPVLAPPVALHELVEEREGQIRTEITQRNEEFLEAEAEKLDDWAEDVKLGLERELKDLDREIKEARRAASGALSLENKLVAQKRIKSLEAQRREKRRSLFDAQDAVDAQRDALIAGIEAKLAQSVSLKPLFAVRWRLI
jgi:ERCC4-related helicase